MRIIIGLFTLAISASAADTFPAAGTIRFERPRGEVNIEGWDRPEVVVSITQSPENQADIKSERRGDEILISTTISPQIHHKTTSVIYNVKAPRDSKIVIDRGEGGVYLFDMTGELDASVHHGQITMSLPQGDYKIDAHSKLGDVYSDFAGDAKRHHWFGHDFTGANTSGHALKLRVDYGDIVLMKSTKLP